jgi:hypothetical protein
MTTEFMLHYLKNQLEMWNEIHKLKHVDYNQVMVNGHPLISVLNQFTDRQKDLMNKIESQSEQIDQLSSDIKNNLSYIKLLTNALFICLLIIWIIIYVLYQLINFIYY